MSSNKLGKIINIILDIILVPIFILTLICFVSATSAKRQNKVPTVFGYSVVTVLTGSMEPEYPARSVVVLKSVKAEDVKVGDIIAFYGGDGRENDMVIFHRVIAIADLQNSENNTDGLYFATQGDANGDLRNTGTYTISWDTTSSSLVLKDAENNIVTGQGAVEITNAKYLVGKFVQNVGLLGEFVKFCSSTGGIILLVVIPSTILLAILVFQFINQIKQYKEEKMLEEQKLDAEKKALKELNEKK